MSELLAKIPDELKPWVAMGIGSFVMVIVVLFHGLGLHRVLVFHKSAEKQMLKGRPHVGMAMLLFGFAVFLLLLLHLVEIAGWAVVLTSLGLIKRVHDAAYFCANAYTTLGFGNVDLAMQWRNISPIIGISGLFTFAWTTSALVNVVAGHDRLLEQLHEEREKAKELRAALRQEIKDVRKKEGEAEAGIKAEASEKAVGTGLWQRWSIWRDENKKVVTLRKEELKDIADLYQKEQAEEDKLGPGDPEAKDERKK